MKTIAVLLALLHPMGNFSINHHSKIHISPNVISITTIMDFAEIATFQFFPDPRKAPDHAAEWVSQLRLQVGGKMLPLRLQSVRSQIVPAPAGLPTLRIELNTTAPWTPGDEVIRFTDGNYASRAGWKEVVISGDSSLRFPEGNPYGNDRSRGLTVYPQDPLSSVPDMVSAKVRVQRKELQR